MLAAAQPVALLAAVMREAVALSPSACGGSTGSAGKLDVVAAENVYGNIPSQIGGSDVSVTSILTSRRPTRISSSPERPPASPWPTSFFIATISFAFSAAARIHDWNRGRQSHRLNLLGAQTLQQTPGHVK